MDSPVPVEGNLDAESCNESDDGKGVLTSLQVPSYMDAVVRRQFLQEMVKKLPEPMQNRIVALKNIQLEFLHLEAKFFEEVYEVEKKYQALYQPLFDKRHEIVTGDVDPPKVEPKWKQEEDPVEPVENPAEFSKLLKEMKIPEDAKGIPNFWLTIFRNTEILSEMIQEHDEPVLKKLTDIKIIYNEGHSYTLEFHFDKNEYFSNPVLTKQYFLKATVDEDYPFGFEGPEVYKCKGCDINWEKKMNLTVKTIRKKQKHKERGAVRTVIKQVPNDSFFNFFNPPQIAEDQEEIDEASQAILSTDFEIGHFLRSRIIPKAVLYYTGDIIDDEDDEDEELEGEDEDDDEADSGDEATDTRKGGPPGNKKKPNPDECRNQ